MSTKWVPKRRKTNFEQVDPQTVESKKCAKSSLYKRRRTHRRAVVAVVVAVAKAAAAPHPHPPRAAAVTTATAATTATTTAATATATTARLCVRLSLLRCLRAG